ncbi:MAG: dTDP-4-dehydrorhamnose reductase [Bacteroidales bacterium]|nr:dTDP-4-dehydrorhamnose reductase [Bacteroidales bacterium]
MKVLVTGANGQLGMCLRSVFSNASGSNAPSVAYKMADAPSGASLPSAVFTDVDELDITNLAAIRKMVRKEGIDTIVNCAGYTDVEGAENRPDLAELLNARAVENLAVAMKEVNGLLLHISTDYVFGGEPLNSPISEDQKPAPMGVYALSKLHGEEAIRRVGCRHIIIRTAWLYSPYGKNFVKTMLRLTAEKPSLKVVDDQRGTPTYAADLAEVIVRFLAVGKAPASEGASAIFFASSEAGLSPADNTPSANIFNFTNEGECTWYEFACAIAELSGHTDCDIQPCRSDEFPSKVHRPAYSVLDKTRIRQTLGITIPHWRPALETCLKELLP